MPAPIGPFVDTAIAAGVRRVVMTSGPGLEHFAGHFGDTTAVAEQKVAATGRGTILRASPFAQGFTEDALATGVRARRIALPGAGRRVRRRPARSFRGGAVEQAPLRTRTHRHEGDPQ
ncbi:hypothetical protein WHI96_21325 [Pseudonocardia tropica]|uniref:Uncharacterized protein n=1 Tax=Pseudonocardia tropica TaxID=681289 RepID=A0ABV1JZI8_9PSEU